MVYVALKENTEDDTEWGNFDDRITSPVNFRREDPRPGNPRM